MNQFPDYASRRYTHWRRSYHMHNWEAIPDRVAAKVGQVPNKYKKLAGAPTSQLKGPRERVYKLPEKLEEEVRRPGSHGLYCMVYFVCVMIFFHGTIRIPLSVGCWAIHMCWKGVLHFFGMFAPSIVLLTCKVSYFSHRW